MNPALRNSSQVSGYTLIEMLVVMAIVAILAYVGISQLTPKSPRAVKSGLEEVSAAFKQARGLALVGGKNVDFVYSTSPARLQVFDYQVSSSGTSTLNTTPLMDVTLDGSWLRNAKIFLTTPPPVGTEADPVASIGALTNLGFTGWTTGPIKAGTSKQGFSLAGTPQTIGSTGVRNVATGGLWLGISGTTPNGKGYPYGVVLITDTGTIVTYYKSDSSKSGSTNPEAAWQRLD